MEGEIVSVVVWRDESWSQLLYRGNEKAYDAGQREKSSRAGRHCNSAIIAHFSAIFAGLQL